MFSICENCGAKYTETSIKELVEVKRSALQNIIKKNEDDREEFKIQPSIYRCKHCGFTLRVKNNERTNKELYKPS